MKQLYALIIIGIAIIFCLFLGESNKKDIPPVTHKVFYQQPTAVIKSIYTQTYTYSTTYRNNSTNSTQKNEYVFDDDDDYDNPDYDMDDVDELENY